jgi:MOSC domain-containing protein YiiM
MPGLVEAIHVAREHGGPTEPTERLRVLAGRGPEGDRHLRAQGERGHDLTLIEAEALEGLAADTGIELGPGEARRNVVTRGIALNDLVGRRFRVGELLCVGEELCEPCRHLESLTQPGVVRGLVHRGGLCAAVLEDGDVAVGDEVEPLPQPNSSRTAT